MVRRARRAGFASFVLALAGIGWLAPAGAGSRSARDSQTAAESPAAVTQLWGRRYDGHDRDHAYATALSPDGTKVFVTGATRVTSPSDDDMLTIAYDASTGATLWSRRFSGPTHELDQAYALGVSPDGSKLFVTGTSHSGTGFDSLTIAYDATTGQRLWLKRYNPNANMDDASYALAVSPDGSKVFVAGFSDQVVAGGSFRSVAVTVAYDAATGATIWLGRYHAGSNGDDAKAIAVSPDGTKVFVAIASHGQTDDYRTVAYAASSGMQLWAVRYDGFARSDRISSLAVNPDGSTVYVTGTTDRSDFDSSYATVAYDTATGSQEWLALYAGGADGSNQARAIAVSPDGRTIYVTGASTTSSSSDYDYATVAYSTAGAELWTARYVGPAGLSDAHALAVTPDGTKVIVTGVSNGVGTDEDYLTLAYTPSGRLIWLRRNNGAGNSIDSPNAIAVSPDSARVVVTGDSHATPGQEDWSTIAYRTG